MTLYQLKIFEAVARHLNVTRVSLELHYTQARLFHASSSF